MRVIKKPEEWKPRQVTCGPPIGCGTVMEVEFSDLNAVRREGDSREQIPSWVEVYVTCPTCSNHIQINDVPTWQQTQVLAKDIPAQWMEGR